MKLVSTENKLSSHNILDIYKKSGLFILPRCCNEDAWENVLQSARYQNTLYTSASIEYQMAYSLDKNKKIQDISVVIKLHDKNVGIWPLSIEIKDDKYFLESHGMAILPPIFTSEISIKSKKKIIKRIYNFIEEICKVLEIKNWKSEEYFDSSFGLSLWNTEGISRGAQSSYEMELFLDLSGGIESIRKGYRESYLHIIQRDYRKFNVGFSIRPSLMLWQKFKNLHERVSGRKTRGDETWMTHYKSFYEKECLLLNYAFDDENEIIGAALFNMTNCEANYLVGAFLRDSNATSIGHVLQDEAIKFFLAKGIKWYRLGRRSSINKNERSKKEEAISYFKEGFSSHIIPTYLLKMNY